MRLIWAGALVLWAGSAGAESLCGLTDEAEILARLAGAWDGEIRVSVETETVSVTEPLAERWAMLAPDGSFTTALNNNLDVDVVLRLATEPVIDVDGVDDLLDTTDSAWIADALSDTPCGPEALPQLTGAVTGRPDVSGIVMLIGYFDDRLLMLIALELRGDHGLAFVSATALLQMPGG